MRVGGIVALNTLHLTHAYRVTCKLFTYHFACDSMGADLVGAQ